MTIRRNAREVFDLDRADLAERVWEVLGEYPIYRDTTERVDEGTLTFTTNVKPNFLFLDTAMHVTLERDERAGSPSTVVDVTPYRSLSPWPMSSASTTAT